MMQTNQQIKSVEDTSVFARQRITTHRISSLQSRLHTLLNLVLNQGEQSGDEVKASAESLDNFHFEQSKAMNQLEQDLDKLGDTLMGQAWRENSVVGINNDYRKQV